MMIIKKYLVAFSIIIVVSFLLTGCFHDWQKDVIVKGIHFDKIRKSSSGTIIGYLSSNTEINDYPCKEGWVHFYENYALQNFTNYIEIQINRMDIPENTWIELKKNGVLDLCAFPENRIVQSHKVIGSGGPKGTHTSFYVDGSLKSFFSPEDVEIDGIPCNGGVFSLIQLHPNGKLKYCTLSEDTNINGKKYDKKDTITLNENGKVLKVD